MQMCCATRCTAHASFRGQTRQGQLLACIVIARAQQVGASPRVALQVLVRSGAAGMLAEIKQHEAQFLEHLTHGAAVCDSGQTVAGKVEKHAKANFQPAAVLTAWEMAM